MLSNIMLKVTFHEFCAEYHYAECRYAECHGTHQRPKYIGKVLCAKTSSILLWNLSWQLPYLFWPLGGHDANFSSLLFFIKFNFTTVGCIFTKVRVINFYIIDTMSYVLRWVSPSKFSNARLMLWTTLTIGHYKMPLGKDLPLKTLCWYEKNSRKKHSSLVCFSILVLSHQFFSVEMWFNILSKSWSLVMMIKAYI